MELNTKILNFNVFLGGMKHIEVIHLFLFSNLFLHAVLHGPRLHGESDLGKTA